MRGTCMVGLVQKPRKQRELSNIVQRGVEAALRRGSQAEERVGASDAKAASGRKRARPAVLADAEMADALLPKPKRRTTNRSRQAEADAVALAATQTAAAAVAGGAGSCGESGKAGTGGGLQRHPSSSHAAAADLGGAAVPTQLQHLSAANSFRSSSQGASGGGLGASTGQGGGKLQLRLVPLGTVEEDAMSTAGYNPYLELTCSSSKSLTSVLRHLCGKWLRALPPGAIMYVHPPPDCPIGLRGTCWGGLACDQLLKVRWGRARSKRAGPARRGSRHGAVRQHRWLGPRTPQVGDIYAALMSPSPFILLYSWGASMGQPAPSSSSAGLHHVSSSGAMASGARQAEAPAAAPRLEQPQQLQAVLREAISAAAEGAVMTSGGAAAPGVHQPHESFTQMLLEGGAGDVLAARIVHAAPCTSSDPATVQQLPASVPGFGAVLQLPPSWQHHLAAAAVLQQQPLPLVQVLLEPGALLATTTTPSAAAKQQQQGDGAPQARAASQQHAPPAEAAQAPDIARKPRGLLGLLQAEPVARKPPPAKQRQRKAAAGGGRRGKKCTQPASQLQLGVQMPLPAEMAPYLWAAQQQVQEQPHAHPSVLQQPAPLEHAQPSQPAALLLEPPGDSLLQLLEGTGNTCSCACRCPPLPAIALACPRSAMLLSLA